MKSLQRNKYFLFWQMLIFILLNGSPNIYIGHNHAASVVMFGVNFIFLLILGIENEIKRFLPFCGVVLIIFLAQLLFVPDCELSSSLIFKMLYGATVLIIFKNSFRYWYLRIMTLLSLFSLIMWLLWIINGFYIDLTHQEGHYDMIIFSIRISMGPDDWIRNSGPFWEPGAFACYILFVPILFFNQLIEIITKNKYSFLILFWALLSSMSTTGYLGLAILIYFYIILYYIYQGHQQTITGILLLLPLSIIIYYVWGNFAFIGDKFLGQFDHSIDAGGDYTADRLGSFLYDCTIISSHPFIGVSFNPENHYGNVLWQMMERGDIHFNGNGLSSIIVEMGIPFILCWCYVLYLTNKKHLKIKEFFSLVLIIFTLLMGEPLFIYPMMYIIPYTEFLPVNQKNIL